MAFGWTAQTSPDTLPGWPSVGPVVVTSMASDTEMKADRVKISANFSPEIFEALQAMANELGISMTEVLRRAIGTEKYFLEETRKGARILLKDKDGSLREVVLR